MAQRFKDEAGNIWEMGANGQPSLVSAAHSSVMTDPRLQYQVQSAAGDASAAPLKAPQIRADIGHAQAETGKTQVDTRAATAALPYVAPKAAAETRSAQALAAINEHKAQEEQLTAAKAELEKFGGSEQVDQLIRAVERAKGLVGSSTAGLGGSALSHIPGTDAYGLAKVIEQDVRGNVFLQRLNAMKEENPSPNGGTGIGRIMQAEIPMITGSSGALDIGMKPAHLLESLNNIERGALRMKAKLGGQNPDDPRILATLMPAPMSAPGAPASNLQAINDQMHAMFQSGASTQDIVAFGRAHGVDPNPQQIETARQKRLDVQFVQPPQAQPGVPQPPTNGGYANSYLGQGISGANEGLADALGAPVDLMTGALNLIPKGINALANTNIPSIADPFAGADWWKRRMTDLGSIQPQSAEPAKQITRRIAESAGSAAVPGMFAGSLPKFGAAVLSGVGSGAGGAIAQQVAPGNPLAEFGGELVGGGLTGLGMAKGMQRAAQRQIESAVPTVDDLKGQAANLYQKAETNGVVASPDQTQQLAAGIHGILRDEGQIGPAGNITNADTNTSKAFNLIQQYSGKEMTPKQMNTVRTVLADSRKSADPADRRLGSVLLDHFDEWARPMAPQFDQARSVASRYLQAQDLERAKELAGSKASQFTGSGFENALRTEYRGLDRGNIKGQNYFAPDVTDAIENVARGTPLSNTLRGLGRFAPTGAVSVLGDLGAGAGMGAIAGSPATGGMFGAGLAGVGMASRLGATRMGIRAADKAELIARNGGALDQAPLLSDEAKKMAAWLAAVQQAKYLSNR